MQCSTTAAAQGQLNSLKRKVATWVPKFVSEVSDMCLYAQRGYSVILTGMRVPILLSSNSLITQQTRESGPDPCGSSHLHTDSAVEVSLDEVRQEIKTLEVIRQHTNSEVCVVRRCRADDQKSSSSSVLCLRRQQA